MRSGWKIIFWVILVWSAFHLFRDIAADIFNIHNPITDFGHRQYPGTYWCGNYCQWTTFPMSGFNLIASLIVLKRKSLGTLGLLVLLSLPLWLYGWLAGEGAYFPKYIYG